MKKKFLLIISISLLFGTGCKKFLSLKPVSEEPDTDVLKTKSNVQSVLNTAYDRTQSDEFVGGKALIASEIYGDNIDMTNPPLVAHSEYGSFSDRKFGIFNPLSRSVLTSGYSTIYNANIVITAVDKNLFADATDAEKSLLKAEALFLRGLAHHTLVRIYALSYSNSPETDPGIVINIAIPNTPQEALLHTVRARVKEVYQQIISDLKAAELALPATNNGRATSWAAKALLARVYFDMGDYATAYTYSNDIITNGGFTLGASVLLPFRNVGPAQALGGVVFQIVNTSGDDASGKLRGEFWNNNAANVMFYVDPVFYNSFDANDARRNLLMTRPETKKGYSLKYMGSNPVNIPVIRLAEMYLTRAESAVRKGSAVATTVRADYNNLRVLAGLTSDITSTTDAELLTAIQRERRFELAIEGDRYYELRRLKQQIKGLAFNDKSQLIKFPDIEMRANPNLEQN